MSSGGFGDFGEFIQTPSRVRDRAPKNPNGSPQTLQTLQTLPSLGGVEHANQPRGRQRRPPGTRGAAMTGRPSRELDEHRGLTVPPVSAGSSSWLSPIRRSQKRLEKGSERRVSPRRVPPGALKARVSAICGRVELPKSAELVSTGFSRSRRSPAGATHAPKQSKERGHADAGEGKHLQRDSRGEVDFHRRRVAAAEGAY
jgi:hypothetical protein